MFSFVRLFYFNSLRNNIWALSKTLEADKQCSFLLVSFWFPSTFLLFYLTFFSLFTARSARILRRWREVSSMLNHISTMWEYHDFLRLHKSHLDISQLKLLKSLNTGFIYDKSIEISIFFKWISLNIWKFFE